MSTIARDRFLRPRIVAAVLRPLSARALRYRNLCLCRLAQEQGLPVPDEEYLASLGSDVSLQAAHTLWKARHPHLTVVEGGAASRQPPRRALHLITRMMVAGAFVFAALAVFPAPLS